MAGIDSLESTVSETLTSEVETMSTGHLCFVEDFENGFQKSMGHQHAGGDDVHDGDALFGGDGFERVPALGRAAVMRVPSFAGLRELSIMHGNIFLDGRQQRCGMQHLRAEVSQFGGFFKADVLDAARILQDSGSVVIMPSTSVQISMRFGAEPCADDGGSEIRAAAPDGGGHAFFR